jgi:translocation and assembly module TamA
MDGSRSDLIPTPRWMIAQRVGLGALAAALVLALGWAAPVAAQAQGGVDPELKALIPDTAVARPEDWAKALAPTPPQNPAASVVPPSSPAASAAAPSAPPPLPSFDAGVVLRPDSPMADMPALSLPWPEGAQAIEIPAPLIAEPDVAAELAKAVADLPVATPPAGATPATRRAANADHETVLAGGHVRLVWPGNAAAFPERESLEIRFRTLSALQGLGGRDQEIIAQASVRAGSDRQLLEKLLHVYGYYDGDVIQTVTGAGPSEAGVASGGEPAAISVRFDVDPGTRYKIATLDVGRLDKAGADAARLRSALGLHPGDPLNLDTITTGIGHLDVALGEAGYPFAVVGAPAMTVDHARFAGDITVPVTPGGKYRFGAITSALPRFMSPGHLGDIARFKPGVTYKRSEVDDLRQAILATGLVSSLTVTPRETTAPQGDTPGTVALDVAMTKAPLHTVAAEVGYDTGEGYRIELGWENRNLFPPEGALKLRSIIGTDEQLVGATLRRSNFLGRDRVLSIDVFADNANLTAYAARKVAFAATYERLTTVLFQKPWTWSMGLEAQASEEREGVPSGVTLGRTLYITTALPLRAGIDTSDDLLDPHRGHRASLRVSPEESWARGVASTYARVQGDASWYVPVKGTVIAGRVRLGSMPGTAVDDVAPSRRFYAGGGASIRGYGYELVGPRNALGEPKGGRSLYEFSLEARVPTGLFAGALQFVPFIDAGGVETGTVPRFNDWRYGAGLGLRYSTGFGPIRIDVGTPLNPRAGDSRVGVYVALGQAF